jgi:histone chaperone ASF1
MHPPSSFVTVDLEWKVLYVSSAENADQDQVLEEVMVGPVPVGVNKFVLQSAAPDVSQIPEEDIIGVTVILITCTYREQEFVRVGYYVNNEYAEPFDPDHPPRPVDLLKLVRNILADKPRVTRFPIDWGMGMGVEGGQQQQVTEEEAAAEGVVDFDALDQQQDGEEEEEEEEEEEGEAEDDRELEGGEESEEGSVVQGDDAMAMELSSPVPRAQMREGTV